jgi:hypothetical protein
MHGFISQKIDRYENLKSYTVQRLDNPGIWFRFSVKARAFPHSFQTSLEANLVPIQWVPWALFPAIKRPGREADKSPPSEVKNNRSCTSLAHIYLDVTYNSVRGQMFP